MVDLVLVLEGMVIVQNVVLTPSTPPPRLLLPAPHLLLGLVRNIRMQGTPKAMAIYGGVKGKTREVRMMTKGDVVVLAATPGQ